MTKDQALRPSDVSEDVSWFDRFAEWASGVAARSRFFAFCVALLIAWVPTLFVLDVNTSQLIINTATTIITFLLIALLQNSQARANAALQHKLNAIAEGVADILEARTVAQKRASARELRQAVGLELRESA